MHAWGGPVLGETRASSVTDAVGDRSSRALHSQKGGEEHVQRVWLLR